MAFRIFWKIPAMSWTCCVATGMRITISSVLLTGVSYTSVLICFHKKKSRYGRSDDRAGQCTEPPRKISTVGQVRCLHSTTSAPMFEMTLPNKNAWNVRFRATPSTTPGKHFQLCIAMWFLVVWVHSTLLKSSEAWYWDTLHSLHIMPPPWVPKLSKVTECNNFAAPCTFNCKYFTYVEPLCWKDIHKIFAKQ